MMGIDPNRLNRSQYHSQLGCGIKRFEYDFATCVARLFLPDGHCTDMDGAIKLALALDDRCVRVETFTGTAPDTRYILRSDGEWYALPAEGGIQ